MLPQLELATYIPQLFWLFVGFSIVWVFSSFVLLPRVVSNLAKRDDHIRANIIAANEAMVELDKISALMNDELVKLASQIHDINDLAKRESVMMREKKMRHIESEIDDFSKRKMLEFTNDIGMSKRDVESTVLFVCELLRTKTSVKSLYQLPFNGDIVSSLVNASFDRV